jgi:hypothetical protein
MTDARAGRFSRMLGMRTVVLALLAVAVLAGCEAPRKNDGLAATRVPTEPNVMRTVALYDQYACWMRNEDKTRITGIYVGAVYLLGPEGKGVFGDGVIRPKLYIMEKNEEGQKVPRLAKEWSFNVEEAMMFRAKEKRAWGWGYGLPLGLGGVDIEKKEIQLVISFERSDGARCSSAPKYFLVP